MPDAHPDSPPPAPRPADPPEPPDLADFDAEAYVTAARSMGVSPLAQNPALEALGAVHHACDAALQQRLDGFRAQDADVSDADGRRAALKGTGPTI